MLGFALLFALTASREVLGVPWYPFMLPIRSRGLFHRHTTHLVPHPIIHTRVVVIEDKIPPHLHQYVSGRNNNHKPIIVNNNPKPKREYKYGAHYAPWKPKATPWKPKTSWNHQRQTVQGRANSLRLQTSPPLKTQARYPYEDSSAEHGEGSYEEEYPPGEYPPKDDYPPGEYSPKEEYPPKYSDEEPIKYSVLVSESPWKPLLHVPNHTSADYRHSSRNLQSHTSGEYRRPLHDVPDDVPRGYLPLKYLGPDEEGVSKVVHKAISETEEDPEGESRPRYPNNIKDLIHPPMKPLPTLYRGAVFYDEDETSQEKDEKTHQQRHPTANYYGHQENPPYRDSRKIKLNLDCQCETPHKR